jgi:NAD dependent epimerase/dehydratase family enzyme
MRVIITGGTGLLGQALASELLSTGNQNQVIVLSRTPERATNLVAGVSVQRWDARSAVGWGSLVDGADAIVNLAGQSLFGRWTPRRKRRILESRVNAGHAVVQAVESARVKPGVVIQASGIGYYGPRADREIDEQASPGEDFLGQTAVACEASTAPVESLGVRRAVMRSGLGFFFPVC